MADISWLPRKAEWKQLICIGAIKTEFESKKGKSQEWHYYISSRKLSAAEPLQHAGTEWAVESMQWLLEIHFDKDGCRAEGKNAQQNQNMLHKADLNTIKQCQTRTGSERPMSKIIFNCLLDSSCFCKLLGQSWFPWPFRARHFLFRHDVL